MSTNNPTSLRRYRVICERCRALGLSVNLGTYRYPARAERRRQDHMAAYGHAADVIMNLAKGPTPPQS